MTYLWPTWLNFWPLFLNVNCQCFFLRCVMFYNFYRDNDEITFMITTHVSYYEAKLGVFKFCKNREEISRSEKKEKMLKVSQKNIFSQ